MEEVPRRTSRTPLTSPSVVLMFIALEAKGLLDFQGRRGIACVTQWNLRPVIFGVEKLSITKLCHDNITSPGATTTTQTDMCYKHSVLTNWGFYEFTFLRDGPYFFKVNAL